MASEKATYTHGHHESVVKSHARRTAQNSAAFLLPHIKPNTRLLDIGCGPGSITIGFAQIATAGEIIGVDVVDSVISQARQLAQDNQLQNISFEAVDANKLPYEDASFDITFCHQVLQHVGDPVAILKEMRRVTKLGGIVAARDADYKSFAWFPESLGMDLWGDVYLKAAKANGAQPNGGRYLLQWAKDAGFDAADVTFTWNCWTYQGDDAEAFGTAWIDRALHSDFGKTAKKHGLATDEDLKNISEAWGKFAKTPDRFIIIPNGEVLCRVKA